MNYLCHANLQGTSNQITQTTTSMKKILPLILIPLMLCTLSLSVKAQEKNPKFLFQGVEKLNSKGGFRYVYDSQNKLKASVYYDSEGKVPHIDSIYYDGQGRINRVDLYMVLSGDVPEKLPLDSRFEYTYDQAGRLHKRIQYMGYAIDKPANTKEFIYDDNGNNTIIRTHLYTINSTVDMKFVYNDKNQLVKSGYPSDSNPDEIVSNIKTYEYDAKGNRTKINHLTEVPECKLSGYEQYNYNGLELTEVIVMDVDRETGKEKPYLSMEFEYDKEHLGSQAYYPYYPFVLDGPMFHNSMVEDAIENGLLRTAMIVVDPDKEEGKNKTTYAYLYTSTTSIDEVAGAKQLIAYKSGNVLTIEGNQLTQTSIYSIAGEEVARVEAQADRIDIPVEALGQGGFVVIAHNASGETVSTKVFL